jgi:hypothetical protein
MTDAVPPPRTPPAAADDPAAAERLEDRPGREPGELVMALSPRQIIGGFALLAGLLIWLRHRGRRKG